MTTENKTVIDLMREYVRVSDMCDAYNKDHGTDIKPWECVKWRNHPESNWGTYTGTPYFHEFIEDEITFAIAILEGRPVFVGDRLFEVCSERYFIVDEDTTTEWINTCTWTPPTKKRTFMLNGVELPCPVKVNKLLPVSRRMEIDSFYFYFDSQEDKKNAAGKLICLLTEARDKE